MRIEWDEEKNRRNLKKHGIDFDLASEVFGDPLARYELERIVDGEERWQAVGMVKTSFLIVVVHCYRTRDGNEFTRIISA